MKRATPSAVVAVVVVSLLGLGALTACGSSSSSSSASTSTSPASASSASKGLVAVVKPVVTLSSSDPTSATLDVIITNGSTAEDTLTAVSVPSTFASKVSVPATPVASGGLVTLSGAKAVSITGVVGSPKSGSTVPVTFTFSGVGDIVVTATVK